MLLSAEHISKNFGDKQLLDDVTLYLEEGKRVGLIGLNGTGKSTFLKILAGRLDADTGSVSTDPNVKLSYLPQTSELFDDKSPLENIFYGDSAEFRAQAEYEARAMLNRLNVTALEQPVGTMSGGQRKRISLVRAFVHPSDVLILDEPTNHLDGETAAWLEQQLARFGGGIVMVTHDRYFLERVVNQIVELSHGHFYAYEANYSKYLELKEQRLEMAESTERKRQALLRREYQWIMRGARARSTKSTERIARYEALKEQKAPETDATAQISAAASRLGKKIIELEHVSKSFDGKQVTRDFSYTLLRDDRIGIVGRNGAGKSTLLNLMAGRISPDSGTLEIGSTVKIGYFSQEGRELDPEMRVYDFVREAAAELKTAEGTFSAAQMLERFLFTPELQHSKIGRLSGGEKRRLFLLSLLMTAPNVLLLDEPTNDLDIETLTVLEDYLQSFPGAVLAVSHDRYFLDKVADHIFEVRADGCIERYVGAYSDYERQRRSEEKEQARPEKKEKDKETDRRAGAPRKLKFSFKEQREYETIDADIAALEEEIARCEAEMAANASDYVALQALEEKKAEFDRQLEEKTERWCYLTELAEKIAAQDAAAKA